MNDELDITAADLEPSILERAHAADAAIVVLPLREVGGTGIYPQSTLTLVKRLRSAGGSAVYLHDPEHRRFEVKKSAVLDAGATVLLGVASSAAWDAIKALAKRGKSSRIEVTYLDLETAEMRGTAWRVAGKTEAVLQAIDSMRSEAGGASPSQEAASGTVGPSACKFAAADGDDDLRTDHVRNMITERRQEADDVRAAAENELAGDEPDRVLAEQLARRSLHFYARSLDWAKDTDDDEDAHRRMDEAGAWVRSTFGCWLEREGETYQQTCPVALAHNRIGFRVGGTATRICSLCGDDFSECEQSRNHPYAFTVGTRFLYGRLVAYHWLSLLDNRRRDTRCLKPRSLAISPTAVPLRGVRRQYAPLWIQRARDPHDTCP
ncbi:MAG TPA: hypothetical protein VGP18_11030 [Solirubrobacteraceae bacterium]|jgi:hypothetical protein|nr:hypothetical protein [Solirubrobacteraceae bacterium]